MWTIISAALAGIPNDVATVVQPGPGWFEAPEWADEPVRIASPTGMSAEFVLRGAQPVAGRPSPTGFRYDGALPGGDLEYRSIPGGVEDWVHLAVAPPVEELLYDVSMTGVAGLRWVEDTLELLDGTGTPRLRVRAPSVVAADGSVHRATLTPVDCDADSDPRAPWGRPVVPLSSPACAVSVRWGASVGDPVRYPASVDPAWVDAAFLVVPRNAHMAVALDDGRVLVAGGYDSLVSYTYITDAELWDPATATWAVTGSMTRGRARVGGALLPSGEVLIPAGDDQLQATADRYDPLTGLFSATAPMTIGRDSAQVAAMADGRVLVTGGCTAYSATCTAMSRNGEVYDPDADTWTATVNNMTVPRVVSTVTPLDDGSVLVVGGCQTFGAYWACYTTTTSVDRFDPVTLRFSAVASLPQGHQGHFAALLGNGEVLIGGGSRNGTLTLDARTWDPTTDTWTDTADLVAEHNIVEAARLLSGGAFVAGSWGLFLSWGGVSARAESFDMVTRNWTEVARLGSTHGQGTTTALADGRVLVAGGFEGTSFALTGESGRSEVWDETCPDTDTDGVCDRTDRCDGFDDRDDLDDDAVPNACDLCPSDPDPGQVDEDGDGMGAACDPCDTLGDPVDSDGDTVCDGVDVCEGFPDTANDDGDGFPNACDLCPNVADNQNDADDDGAGDACDPCPSPGDPVDSDLDGACDGIDACPGENDRVDLDVDGQPDACDPCPEDRDDDSDGDEVCDSDDVCRGHDDQGPDGDEDGTVDACDLCPQDADDQRDSDANGFGDACDCEPLIYAIRPSANEVCNGVDDDCDGAIDDDPLNGALLYVDADADGWGAGRAFNACPGGDAVSSNLDCDDADATVHPGAGEECDGVDDDCDGEVDPGCSEPPPPDEAGCGCTTSPGGGSVAFAFALAVTFRRRRQR